MPEQYRSVSGFSHLEYVFAVSQISDLADGLLESDVKEAISRSGDERIHRWLIEVGIRTGRRPGRIIDHCIDAMKHKWGLVEQKGNILAPTERLLRIRELLKENLVMDAKIELLDAILRSRRETSFHPSNLLLKMRNSPTGQSIRITFSGRRGRASKRIEELSPEFLYPSDDGLVVDDHIFVHESLTSNFRAFDIMCDWGVFFELLDYSFISTDLLKNLLVKHTHRHYLKEIAERHGYDSAQIYRPAREVYPTTRMASLEELMIAHNHGLQKLDLGSFAQESVREVLHMLSPNPKVKLTVEKITELAFEKKGLLVSDGPEHFGIMREEETWNLNSESSFLLAKPRIAIETFKEKVEDVHKKLTRGRPIVPVWVGDLAENVCKMLRISQNAFEDKLLKLKREGFVVFHKAPLFIAGTKRRRRKPIKDETGRSYQQVSLV